MAFVTSIGLDVHARSVSARAFDPFTGEVAQRTFGTDAAEIAGWILGFEEPKAVYGSGPTGFALCRELRALGVDCAAGAVSRMLGPSAGRGARTIGATRRFQPACSPPATSSRCGRRPPRPRRGASAGSRPRRQDPLRRGSRIDASPGRAQELLRAAARPRPTTETSKAFRDEGPGRRIEMR